jgi:hypothetical protein
MGPSVHFLTHPSLDPFDQHSMNLSTVLAFVYTGKSFPPLGTHSLDGTELDSSIRM